MNSDKMSSRIDKISPIIYTRVAGVLSIILLLSGTFAMIVESKLFVSEDAITTANSIIASELLFRLGFVSNLIMLVFFILYALVLFKIYKSVNKSHALLMVIFALIGVPIAMVNQLNQIAVLLLAKEQMHDQMMLFFNLHQNGYLISGIFWGIWLFPLGYLVFKSGFVPKILGVLLMIGCFGYLIRSFQGFLLPRCEAAFWSNKFLIVTHIAEVLHGLWLLIMGVNTEKWKKWALESDV